MIRRYQPLKRLVETANSTWYLSHELPYRALSKPFTRHELDDLLDKHRLIIPDSLYRYLTLVSSTIVLYSPMRFDPSRIFHCNGRPYLIISNGGDAIDLGDDEYGGRVFRYTRGKSGYVIISQLENTFYDRLVKVLYGKG